MVSGSKVTIKLTILCVLAITFEPDTLENQSQVQKPQFRLVCTKNFSKILPLAVDAQGLITSAKKA